MSGPYRHPRYSPRLRRALVNQYCAGCHNDKLKSGGFSWTKLDLAHPEQNAEQAEKVIRKLRAGLDASAGMPRPDAATMKAFAASLENGIDQAAAAASESGPAGAASAESHRVRQFDSRSSGAWMSTSPRCFPPTI